MLQHTTLNVGVLLVSSPQLLDIAAVDLLAMTEKFYLRSCQLPEPVVTLGLDKVNIQYIGENVKVPVTAAAPPPLNQDHSFIAPKQTTLIPSSGKVNLQLTTDIGSASVAPGQLDILVIPGADPAERPSPAVSEFVRSHAESGTTDVLVICTGAFVAAHSGILKGKEATGPKTLAEPLLKRFFPDVHWTAARRWVVDDSGKLWTSGGITNGLDLVAEYLRQKVHPGLAGVICSMAEVGDRPAEYQPVLVQ